MSVNIPYKRFCWSLGTTSFRTKNFNKTIELQLSLLDEFWKINDNAIQNWSGNNILQEKYYNFMKNKGFVDGDAGNKAKDAREKTSGLVDIGLINNDRKLTFAGKALLKLSLENNFSDDNIFRIAKDSFIYLKQMLKTYDNINGKFVRQFIVLLYLLSKLDYLTFEEFTYLLPLCTDKENTEKIIKQIKKFRNGSLSINDIIIKRLMEMDNYKSGFDLLINSSNIDEDIICTIGINRKSRNYDKPYFPLYRELYKVFMQNDTSAVIDLFKATKKINIGTLWRNYLFDTISEVAIKNSPDSHLKHTMFSNVSSECEFKEVFYKVMHLLKARATLADYKDLNRRYIKTTDIILFEDNIVKLDIIPKQFFNSVIKDLYSNAFVPSNKLEENCDFKEIDKCLIIDQKVIIQGINKELNTKISDISEAYAILDNVRYKRLHHLIDNKFTDDKILILLDLFMKREDSKIIEMVTDNADVPTIFEYVLGILWYKVSDYRGKVLDYMKLSLDADLLPKTHASGGEADIVYEYEQAKEYPKHTLLIEATLADGTNQRRMEMEPVSRHLGQYLIKTGNLNSYCVFATNDLNINVISDFRGRKNNPYYDSRDYSKYVDGMKIIPLEIDELKVIINNKIKYKELYPIFDIAHNLNKAPHIWYDECIKEILNNSK